MTRDLSLAEQKVLAAITARIDAIVALGTVAELTATTVLNGPGGAPDYHAFQQRFARLGHRMREVTFVVREDLPATMGANTVISNGEVPSVREIQLRPSLVGPGTRGLTNRVLTLVHELSHSLNEGIGNHPVKDYAYRRGWAWTYLSAELARSNADTYAAAAALLVERSENAWGRYQTFGRLPARRGLLAKRSGTTTLGGALAWLDIMVNRAWVRASDCEGFAWTTFTEAKWNTPEWSVWKRQARLLELENQLASWGYITRRTVRDGVAGLLPKDQAVVAQLFPYLSQLKYALDRIDPVLAEGSGRITFDSASGALRIPRATVDCAPLALAELLLDAVIEGTAGLAEAKPFAQRARELVRALVDQDREVEGQGIATLRSVFAAVPAVRPSAAEWAALAVELDAAVLADMRFRWERTARDTPAMVALPDEPDGEVLTGLAAYFAEDIEALRAVRGRTPVPQDVLGELAAMIKQTALHVTKVHPGQRSEFEKLRARVEALA
ncbi:hypothetical protein ACIPYS_34575 [Kitasatospora sp. NPDC089913]|uniref:hypothetical protein n=1 Tax=Streptomycetaceae TaxID=2062 RepID=UPI00087CE4E9|nr:hypothetical protein [Streptomyces sp. TLI_053]SDT05400.1 hypothetical protein SAMN05216371_1187 [Streptomyces sp. TLI_053]